MSHHIIQARDVRYSYPDGCVALDGVTFTITHGEAVGLVGANGAGKSTLLMLLCAVLFPTSGEISVGQTVSNRMHARLIHRKAGVVFQDPDSQLFMPTVFEDVAFGPRNMGLDEKSANEQAWQALDSAGAAHVAGRAPHRLSSGEKRLAAVATALSTSPDILLMDEPTSMLDPRARRRVIALISGFTHTRVLTTHDLDMALEVCTRVIVLDKGRVAADGKPRALLSDYALLDACGMEPPLSMQRCPACGRTPLP